MGVAGRPAWLRVPGHRGPAPVLSPGSATESARGGGRVRLGAGRAGPAGGRGHHCAPVTADGPLACHPFPLCPVGQDSGHAGGSGESEISHSQPGPRFRGGFQACAQVLGGARMGGGAGRAGEAEVGDAPC